MRAVLPFARLSCRSLSREGVAIVLHCLGPISSLLSLFLTSFLYFITLCSSTDFYLWLLRSDFITMPTQSLHLPTLPCTQIYLCSDPLLSQLLASIDIAITAHGSSASKMALELLWSLGVEHSKKVCVVSVNMPLYACL